MKKYSNTRYFLLFLLLSLQVTKFINTGIGYNNINNNSEGSHLSAGDYVHMVEMLEEMLKKRKEPAKITEENTPKPKIVYTGRFECVFSFVIFAGGYMKLVEMLNNMLKKRKEPAKITEENTPKPKAKPKAVEITKKNTTKPKTVPKPKIVYTGRFECVFSTDTRDLNRHVKNRCYNK